MAQCDVGVIVHMHLFAATAAGHIFIISQKRTAKADHSPAGCSHAGGSRLIHEAVQAGRNLKESGRLCKC